MNFKRAFALTMALGLAGATTAQANWWQSIQTYSFFISQPFAHSNGQKIVTGRYNILHLVYEDEGNIYYTQSSDGLAWSAPTVLACGNPGRLPAIGADSSGKLAVVWVDDTTTSLQYVYYNGSTWSMPATIVADGDEPSIAVRGGQSYLTWRTGAADRIRYAQFPIATSTLLGSFETVDLASCATDNYRLPSIALTLDPCKPAIPVIGYLYSRTSPCMAGSSIGPRVCKRDNSLGTWSMTWQDPRTSASTAVESISLSLASRYSARQLYVAYSDVQGGVARTRLGHGNSNGWSWSAPATIDAFPRHIHVRANEAGNSPVGTFRIARALDGSTGADFRDGVWSTAAAPTWSTAWTGTSGPPAARPHAHFWKRCASGTQTSLFMIGEDDLCLCPGAPPTYIAAEVDQQSPCPPNGPLVALPYPCKYPSVAVGVHVGPGLEPVTVVDVSEAGVVKSIDNKGAIISTENGGRIDVTWSATGKVLAYSDTTFSLNAPVDSVRFTSSTDRFSVEKDGTLTGYDRAPGGESCRR